MNILQVFYEFTTQEQAIQYLEKVRWGGEPACLYCGSLSVGPHASPDRKNRRWQCRDCHKAFSVTQGTIFHGTHMPLRTWFLVLALMLNAKKSASSYQISRDLGVRRPTVWSMMHRIRIAMATSKAQERLLYGIIEMDETYIGGKPRKGNRRTSDEPSKRGRGTNKVPVIGMVERGGRVIAKASGRLTGESISAFVDRYLDKKGALLITDEYRGYAGVRKSVRSAVINHSERYADGRIHTNSIEGFWALLKRAWYGQHHHFDTRYLPLYIAEACYKYNIRKQDPETWFGNAMAVMVQP